MARADHKPPFSETIPWKKWWFWLIVAFVALVVIGALSPKDQKSSSTQPAVQVAPQTKPQAQAPRHEVAPKPQAVAPQPQAVTPPPQAATPEPTMGQQNALQAAQDYIGMTGMSKAGLIEQLSSNYGEGFSKADATWAANHVNANWNAEAVEAAKDYLQMGGMSRSALYDQLSSSYGEQFTPAQAQYAVNVVYGG